ncbi:MAG: hypothetical protein AB7P23_02850, partial [Amphiplicatus sp.]
TAYEIAEDVGVLLFGGALMLGAAFFFFGGVAWALSGVVAPPLALILTGVFLGLIGAVLIAVQHRRAAVRPAQADPPAQAEATRTADPVGALMGSLTAFAGSLDAVAAGVFTRQLRRAPIPTLAATVAAGVLLGLMAEAGEE